jgi:hypothetical protein
MPTGWEGLGDVADPIVSAMGEYHKRHVAENEQQNILKLLTQVGTGPEGRITAAGAEFADPNDQTKTIKAKPFLGQKEYDLITSRLSGKREERTQTLEMVNKLILGQAVKAAGQEQKFMVDVPGVGKLPLTAGQAATLGGQRASAGATESRFTRGQEATESRFTRGQESAAQKEARIAETAKATAARQAAAEGQRMLEKRPEYKFSQTYGRPPQDILNAAETGYSAVQSGTGQSVADVPPLQPGENLKDYRKPLTGWEQFWEKHGIFQSKVVPPEGLPIEYKPKSDVYRETELTYPAEAKTGRPAQKRRVAYPEGETLVVGKSRIPMTEVAKIRSQADSVKAELIQNMKEKPQLRDAYRGRLQQLGWNPDDPFWADALK